MTGYSLYSGRGARGGRGKDAEDLTDAGRVTGSRAGRRRTQKNIKQSRMTDSNPTLQINLEGKWVKSHDDGLWAKVTIEPLVGQCDCGRVDPRALRIASLGQPPDPKKKACWLEKGDRYRGRGVWFQALGKICWLAPNKIVGLTPHSGGGVPFASAKALVDISKTAGE